MIDLNCISIEAFEKNIGFNSRYKSLIYLIISNVMLICKDKKLYNGFVSKFQDLVKNVVKNFIYNEKGNKIVSTSEIMLKNLSMKDDNSREKRRRRLVPEFRRVRK